MYVYTTIQYNTSLFSSLKHIFFSGQCVETTCTCNTNYNTDLGVCACVFVYSHKVMRKRANTFNMVVHSTESSTLPTAIFLCKAEALVVPCKILSVCWSPLALPMPLLEHCPRGGKIELSPNQSDLRSVQTHTQTHSNSNTQVIVLVSLCFVIVHDMYHLPITLQHFTNWVMHISLFHCILEKPI